MRNVFLFNNVYQELPTTIVSHKAECVSVLPLLHCKF